MRIKRVFHVVFLLIAISAFPLSAFAQKAKKPAKPRIKPITAQVTVSASKPTAAQRRLEAFNTAWATISQSYFDKTFGGLDWNKIRAEYEPRVKAAKTDMQFHVLLEEMINRLGKSHLSVIVPEYFEKMETAKKVARARGKRMAAEKAGGKPLSTVDEAEEDDEEPFVDPANLRYGIGVELRMIDSRIVVSSVDKQSGAVIAGLKPGYVIDQVNGVSIKSMVDEALIDGTSMAEIKYLFPIQLVEFFLNGEPETSVFLSVLDEYDKPKELTVPRLELAGESISISNNLPDQFLKFESTSINNDVGYVKFNAFAVPVIDKFCDSLTQFRDKKAIIVDLRGNLGGILSSMIGLSGMMTNTEMTLGNFVSRNANEPFKVPSKNKNFKGRIVVLVDGLSMSAAELFTAGLQGNKRAMVVGERTGGQSLPAVWTKLSTGAVMVYPVADFITPKGISLEGTGLEPDYTVPLDRKSLLGGVDPQLQKAVAIVADDAIWPTKTVAKVLASTGDISTSGPPPPPAKKASDIAVNTGQPPPPAPLRLTKLGSVDVPNPDRLPSDAQSLKTIADFTTAVGGKDAFKEIGTYEAKGTMTVGAQDQASGSIYSARQFPDKYMMVFSSPATGEVREIFNGKSSVLQTDVGIDRPLFPDQDTSRLHLFSAVFDTLDLEYHKNLKYEGEFEIEGRKRHIITGRDPRGQEIGMSFDSVTKMLVTYTVPGMLYTFADYKKAGAVTLPFSIDLERMSKIRVDTVVFNVKLDAALFEKKEKCFDKAN